MTDPIITSTAHTDIVKKAKKKLKEMNLMDNLLFQNILADPTYGEPFCRMLLEIILHRKIGNIEINAEKAFYGIDSDTKGIRLDLFIKEYSSPNPDASPDLPDVVFDLEPQKYAFDLSLPKRSRYYHSMLDVRTVPIGTIYPELPESYVIMFLDKDPFGKDRMIYTVKNIVKEDESIPYEDGATTVFFYTKGRKGSIPKDLEELLKYMINTRPETAVNDVLKKMQKIVEHIKLKEGVSKMIINYEEERARMRAEGLAEGRAEEKANTEKERLRAEAAEAKIKELEAEIVKLKNKLDENEK